MVRLAGWWSWCCLVVGLSLAPAQVVAQESAAYHPLSAVLRIGAPRLVIGEEQRESPALFGQIRGVAVDAQHHIYVLDASDHSVRRFAPSGAHIVSAGRSGRGPGDLADPYSLWHDGDHTLYVVDWVNGINEFDTRDGQLVYRRRFAEGRGTMAVCRLRGQFIAAGFHEGHILHVIGASGDVVRSFGGAFRPDTNALVQKVANTGSVVLTCDEAAGRLYVSQAAHGQVRSYNAAGDLLWETVLPGFQHSRVLRDSKGAVVVIFPKHLTEAIRPVGREHILVQAHHKERRMEQDTARGILRPRRVEVDLGILTYVVSARDGKVITRQYGGPFLVAGAGYDVVGYDDDPFPRVFILRVSTVVR